ncbi:MAG: hypothetical protein Q4D21_03160 [Phascolarctobacterium sp.]|nr:hypothetical protein [Phascolarctobacterium sp.]
MKKQLLSLTLASIMTFSSCAYAFASEKEENLTDALCGASVGTALVAGGQSAALGAATTFGTASTGAAVSSLSGAAATNAAMAVLGGGTVATGGGGVAAGAAVLSAIPVVGGAVLIGSLGYGLWCCLTD